MNMKILVPFLIVMALTISASATLPSWIESMNPGDSSTSGTYSASTAFAESAFTPTGLVSGTYFGQGVTGGQIDQSVGTSITGAQQGDVDRQYLVAQGSGFVNTYAVGTYYDPEAPTTSIIDNMGISKSQSADFSGALVPGLGDFTLTVGPTDLNADGIKDDPYSGGHGLMFYSTIGADPSWTATYNDHAQVGIANGPILRESLEDAAVTISADAYAGAQTATDIFMIDPNSGCTGAGEIWKGFATLPYDSTLTGTEAVPYTASDGQTKLADPGTLDQLKQLSQVEVPQNAQLTELGSTETSTVSLRQTYTTGAAAPVTTIAGSNSLGASWSNAKLDPGVALVVDYTAPEAFSYWWS